MDHRPENSNLSEKLTLFMMLFAIFFALFFGLESHINSSNESFFNNLKTQQRLVVEKIATKTEPRLYLTKNILPVLRICSENHQIDLNAVREDCLRSSGLELSIYQFNKHGKLTKTSPAHPENLWLMRNLFPFLHETDHKKVSQGRKSLDKKIEFAFGYGKDLNSLRGNPEVIIDTVLKNCEGVLAWTARPKGGLIITCQNLPSPASILKKYAEKFNPPDDLRKFGMLTEKYQTSNSLPARALRHLTENSSDSGSFAGMQWHFISTASARRFYAAFADKPAPYSRLFNMSRLILAILALCILPAPLMASSKTVLSLKKLVIIMFFASSFIPLSIIALTTINNIDIFTRIHLNKLRSAQEETLGNIVPNFHKYLAECSTKLVQMTNRPGIGQNDPETITMAKKITALFPDAVITVRNSAGKLLFRNASEFSAGRETVFKSLSRKLVERYAPERLSEHEYNGNPFSDSMVNKDDMGFSTLLNYPDRLQLVSTGNSESLLFYRLLPKSAGDCAIVMVDLSTFLSIKNYLKNLQKTPQAINGTSLLLSAFHPTAYKWSLPPLKTHEQQTLELAETAYVSGKAQFRQLTDKLDGFALCIPSSELSGNCLVAFCSAEPFNMALARMKSRIFLGCLIAFIMLISIATWISRQLISPLTSLETGIQALAQRNFETRLPVPNGKDEFVNLFSAFNEMMAESYDMQIAHNVQEGLVPSTFPEIPEYSLYGMIKAASDLGGDCLDCFQLPDGNLLFLVGDLTGHGVGSALMMAFTRAITFHWSRSAKLSPASLADQIDHMLRENPTEKMFMGIICGVLNIKTHQIELVVKGHIYPLKLCADGSSEWIGLPAYPLGIARQTPARSLTVNMSPGDKLLCMTDGFLEAHDLEMRNIGFDKIEIWAREMSTVNAKVLVDTMESRFRKWCENRQSDDISMFALIRKNGDKTDEA